MSFKLATTTLSLSIFLSLLYLSFNIEITHAQLTFDTTYDNQYKDGSITCGAGGDCTVQCRKTSACQNAQITCRNDQNCAITCTYTDNSWVSGGDYDSCNSATITCPTTTTDSCAVTCTTDQWTDQRGCNNLNIIWTVGGINTLKCDKSCSNVLYPPPISDSTPLTINCDVQEECYGTIITCPLNAQCDITCSAEDSCRNTVINCPVDSQCNVLCSGTDSCNSATINWSSTPNLGSLQCTIGGNECLNVVLPSKSFIASDNFTDYIVTCDGISECQGVVITCPTNANCNIICSALNACNTAVIECPINSGNCIVTCSANSACKNADIQWIDGLVNSISCGAFDSSCYGIHFKPYDENTPWVMDCTLASNMCNAAVFDCPQNADCTIKCDPVTTSVTNVCQAAVINGPVDHKLTVMCNQGYACQAAQLHAEHTSFFTLDCLVSGSYTCTSQWIWFPENVAGTKMSIIYGRDDSFSDGSQQPQLFYAINGWADVDIQYDVNKNWGYHSGTMYCNINYVQSCAFATNAFACGTGDNCDNPISSPTAPTANPIPAPTNQPTKNPSPAPTFVPTPAPTSNPTQLPTKNPTNTPIGTVTDTPTTFTLEPTPAPTSVPTVGPTVNPTPVPTQNQSDSPTKNPSKFPSESPTKPPTGNTGYPSATPTKAPSVTQSPSVQPSEAPLNTLITAPTPSPTNREAGVDDETTASISQTEDIEDHDQDDVSLKLDKNSFTNGPIFFTIVGFVVGLLLFACVFFIYCRMKKRQKQIKSIKDTFHRYASERAGEFETSPRSCTDNENEIFAKGARKGSISLQELDPTDTNPQNNWDTNPYDNDNANYGSYHPNKGAISFNQVSSLSGNINGTLNLLSRPDFAAQSPQNHNNNLSFVANNMMINMANNVNEMINHVMLSGPSSPVNVSPPAAVMGHDEGPDPAAARKSNQQFKEDVGSITSVNGVLMEDIVNEMETPQFPTDEMETAEESGHDLNNHQNDNSINVVNTDTDTYTDDDDAIIGDDEIGTMQ